jgi:hypothetical protein
MTKRLPVFLLVCSLAVAAHAAPVVSGAPTPSGTTAKPAKKAALPSDSFAATCAFLDKHTKTVVLTDGTGQGRVVVAPEYFGRIMASTYGGETGPTLGWINNAVVAGKKDPKFANYGGAERMWISPEGGQFSTFFKPGAPFDFANWFVPAAFNDTALSIVETGPGRLGMSKGVQVANYLGTKLILRVDRMVSLVGAPSLKALVGCDLPAGVDFVGYRSDNSIWNMGSATMTLDSGLVSIWILSMFTPSKNTVVIAPVVKEATGPVVIDDYFGKVPASRLVYDEAQGAVAFKADGKQRGKIGLPPERARDVVASMDFEKGILTVMKFSRPTGGKYLKNSWQKHDDVFGGDVVNGYNDGPPGPGLKALGGFYELENLSPARELARGEKLTHWSTVLHFHGPLDKLNAISQAALGVDLKKLPKPGARPKTAAR